MSLREITKNRRWIAPFLILIILAIPGTVIVPKPAQAVCASEQGLNSMTTIASGSNLYMLWESSTGFQTDSNVGNYSLFFKKSSDGGQTFGQTIRLYSTTPLPCKLFSQMAIGQDGQGGENVYVMWQDQQVYFRASNDGGTSFGDTISLGQGSLGSLMGPAFVPWGGQLIAGPNNHAYIALVVYNQTTRHGDLKFMKSDNGGKSFSNALNFTSAFEDHQEPQLAVSDGNVYLAWIQYVCNGCGDVPWCGNMGPTPTYECQTKVMFAKSSNGGKTFDSTSSLAEGNTTFVYGDTNITASDGHQTCNNNFYCGLPHQTRIKAAGSDVYISWFYGPNESYFIKSSDNGHKFTDPVRLSEQVSENESSSVYYSSPFIMADGGSNRVLAGWLINSDYAGSSLHILKSSDGGNHFAKLAATIPQGFEEIAALSKRFIITGNDTLYFLWSPSSDSNKILFEAVHENQSDASKPFVIYSPSNASIPAYLWQPAIAATDSGRVYVIWQNATNEYVKDLLQPQLLLRTSTDGGQTFGDANQFQEVVMVPEFGSLLPSLIAAVSIGVVTTIVSRRYSLRK